VDKLPECSGLADDQYQVFAMRYGRAADRLAHENFMSFPKDLHDGPMPVDYNLWVVRNSRRTLLVDIGFGQASAAERHRKLDFDPVEGLARIGIDPAAVEHVVITHLHFDHAGNIDRFPKAKFFIQEAEVAYATGPCMCHKYLRGPFRLEDVLQLIRKVYAERVVFFNGDADPFPGIQLKVLPGHSMGLQSVLVNTVKGPLLLASDVAHFYTTFLLEMPSRTTADIISTFRSFRALTEIAGAVERVIPGHDPKVRALFPNITVNGVELTVLHEPALSKEAAFFEELCYAPAH